MPRTLALAAMLVLVLGAAGPTGGAVRADAASDAWLWPVDSPRTLVRAFIAPATPYAAGHRGIDIGTDSRVVSAPAAGVVFFAGVVVDRPVLSIRHPGGLVSSFEPVESALAVGTPVGAGDVVGTLLPGHCATACLHFGVRLDGEYVSPLNYLGGIARSVLLPTRWPP